MSFEVKFKDEDGAVFRSNPARDIAYFWPQIMQHVINRCHRQRWAPEMVAILEPAGIVDDDLRVAVAAMCDFCSISLRGDLKSPKVALTESGFFAAKPLAQFAVTSLIGEVCAGAFWVGIKSATPAGEEPNSAKEMAARAAALHEEAWA